MLIFQRKRRCRFFFFLITQFRLIQSNGEPLVAYTLSSEVTTEFASSTMTLGEESLRSRIPVGRRLTSTPWPPTAFPVDDLLVTASTTPPLRAPSPGAPAPHPLDTIPALFKTWIAAFPTLEINNCCYPCSANVDIPASLHIS